MEDPGEAIVENTPLEPEKLKRTVVIAFDNPTDMEGIDQFGEVITAIKPFIDKLPNMKMYAGRGPTAKEILHICELKREDSNLVRHAKRELELIGEEQETIDGYLRVIQAFADMGHSGGSASVAIPTINELLHYHNLSRLTNRLEEWNEVGADLWQNSRNSAAFSTDGGATYHLVDEELDAEGKPQIHTSEPYSPPEETSGIEA